VCVCMHLNDSIYHKMAAKQQHASKHKMKTEEKKVKEISS